MKRKSSEVFRRYVKSKEWDGGTRIALQGFADEVEEIEKKLAEANKPEMADNGLTLAEHAIRLQAAFTRANQIGRELDMAIERLDQTQAVAAVIRVMREEAS